MADAPSPPAKSARGGAIFVAAGIFLSRIAGLIRGRVFAHYFGKSLEADVFFAALRIPNFLQNLLGEGVLSASFIPVYARLLGEKKSLEADRVAGVIATLLAVITSILALLGVLFAPHLIDLIVPGFEGHKRELTVQCVQIMFPGVALLVMSAWCLGVLNSHRKYFLSYVAPVVWNFSIIGVLIAFGGRQALDQLARTASWGLVLGSFLQFAVQVPTVWRLAPDLKFSLEWASQNVRKVLTNFSSVVLGRGVVQISAYIDSVLASWLPNGAVAALNYAQTLYLLPVSLFGMSVSAANLAEISRQQVDHDNTEEGNAKLRAHLDRGLQQIAFFIVPSTAALVFLGDIAAAAIFQSGEFQADAVKLVWLTLAGSGVGLLASTLGRLYSSTFYALQDAKTPLRFAIVRVLLTTVLGYLGGLHVPGWLGVNAIWGTVGLTATAGMAGWVEFSLLRRALNRKIGVTGLKATFLARLWGAALIAAAGGWGVKYLAIWFRSIHAIHPVIIAVGVFGVFGVLYFAGTAITGVPQAIDLLQNIRRKVLRR
ncbi:murein biosynthesis integral membrane protein MurJ [Luteolibacter pohnpeiensis]|uniref:Probable lipid II flippase MurJ n=1 Tax=Luteolibacter pohnpeiensis TaxID=454153 RepID=A0A934S649_9BACT|nr:murein biosynthesis integral membrane protein MurJ [Luteolibacter pohnpeiensis]MBK1882568.1 murein biosynthesis integral membrane protein MurJ [Luteolibacter pohnpeiensis]